MRWSAKLQFAYYEMLFALYDLRQSATSMTTAMAVSPAAQPVNTPPPLYQFLDQLDHPRGYPSAPAGGPR